MTYNDFIEKSSYVGEPDLSGNYTAADFITWRYEGFAELIRGKIFKMAAAPSIAHQRVARNLVKAFLSVFNNQSCEFFFAPFDVYFVKEGEDYKKTKNVAESDICVVCDKNKIHRRGCIGSPDLIVEIISPSTIKHDVKDKLSVYEEYGVKEYWIVHPHDETIIVNVLENGKYIPSLLLSRGHEIRSSIFPDLILDPEKIFPEKESY